MYDLNKRSYFTKLLFNRLGDLKGTIDTDNHFLHNDSIIACVLWNSLAGVDNKSISSSIKKFSSHTRVELEKLSQTVDLRFLLGVMLSEYGAELLRDQRSGDYHIYPEHLRNIPIPYASKEEQIQIAELVEKIIKIKDSDSSANIDEYQRQIDVIVPPVFSHSYNYYITQLFFVKTQIVSIFLCFQSTHDMLQI